MKTIVPFVAIVAIIASLTEVNQALHYFKRSRVHFSSIFRRDGGSNGDGRPHAKNAQQPDPTAPGYFTRDTCPDGFHCTEVDGLPMWQDHVQADHCSPGGGFTCAFKDGKSCVARCPKPELDDTFIQVFMNHGDSYLQYSDLNDPDVLGTFGPDGTEIVTTDAYWAKAYIGCDKH